MFWLVQRLVSKDRPEEEPSPLAPVHSAARRFDDQFGCEYMGSSEFEFMTIPNAFQRMHALALEMRPVEITRKGVTRTVYFIAPSSPEGYKDCDGDLDEVTGFDRMIAEFNSWFSSEYLRVLEQPYFEYYFAEDWPKYFHKGDVSAWWSLNDNIAWTLDEEVAQRLLDAFSPAAVTA
jgi:hypothetical protein